MLGVEKKIEFECRFDRIVMTGFRATGKSAVGIRLAERLGFDFIDTDTELCSDIGSSIAEYVSRNGWPAFRQKEQELLGKLADKKNTVIATGGGAILHRTEWEKLRRNSLVIWLKADAGTIRQRMRQDEATAGQRPSLTGTDCGDEVEMQLQDREVWYREGSDISIDSSVHTPDHIVQFIMREIFSESQR